MAIDVLTLALAKKMSGSGSGGIDVTGAEVGQTIVVKAVDENGKPTEWKAADLPDGVSDEQATIAVNAWLNEHPEATTTVQDRSISTDKLADGAITPDKTDFFKRTTTYVNLFDKDNAEAGYVSCETGKITADNLRWTCPAFPVTPGKSYYVGRANGKFAQDIDDARQYAFYDKNMNPVVQPPVYTKGAWNPIPDGVAYMRVTVLYSTARDTTMVVEGLDVPTKYISYADGISTEAGWKDDVLREAVMKDTAQYVAENVAFSGDRIIDDTIPIKKNDWAKTYNLNIVNPDSREQNVSLNSAGKTYPMSGYSVSDFFPVEQGKRYFVHGMNGICWYNEKKEFISFTSTTKPMKGAIAPDGAFYGRTTAWRVNDYRYCDDSYPYGTKLTVIDDEAAASAMSNAINICGTVTPLTMERWNLAEKGYCFNGSINYADGTVSHIGSGGDVSNAYIVDVTPGVKYVALGYNTEGINVLQFDADWNYLGNVFTGKGNIINYYTAEENVAHAMFAFCNGFVAVSDETKDSYLQYLATTTAEIDKNFAAKYIPVGIEEYMRKAVLQSLINGESDLLLQSIHNSNGLKWNCLGDSLTTLGWGLNMYSMVSEKLGLTPRDYGIVSSTIANYNNDGTTGNPMCVRYANMEDDADIVTVMGGTNDWAADDKIGTMADRDSTTLYGGCHVLFRGLIEKYPNAKIGVILPPQNGQGIPSYVETQGGDPDMAKMRKKVNIIREVAEYYSLPVCDLFNHGGIPGMLPSTINRLLQGDYLHITTAGYKVLARPLLAFIEDLIG